jgi:hypothetical protein
MKRLYTLGVMALLVATIGFVGCDSLQQNDEDAIRALLAGSGYTGEQQESRYGSSDSTLGSGGEDGLPVLRPYEFIPFVRFHRYIPRSGVTRTVNVTIPAYPGFPDTTALAVITTDLVGELRTMWDTTTNPIQVWRKPFHDVAVRKVFLTRPTDTDRRARNGWVIRKVSPLAISTQDAAYNLRLVRLYATARLSGDTFELTTADTMLTKDDLPTFRPSDTVTVQITVESDGDSCWAFLHRGLVGDERPRHWRQAYWKTGTHTFERTWVVGDESYERPNVRPSVHDAIGWGSLWQDTTKPYVAAAWGVPYIVRNSSDAIPNDE